MKRVLKGLFGVLGRGVPGVSFAVRFWDGDVFRGGEGEPRFTLGLNTEGAARNLLSRGTLGFGEEYVEGGITVEGDFKELMRFGMDPHFQDMELSWGTKVSAFLQHLKSLNTAKGAARNIAHHYDLGNELYRLYLDESMTYSCAYFESPDDSLEEAQERKYEHICRKLRLKPGETLVDIGCGWGGMLIYAAEHYGVQGVGCSLSTEQVDYAKERVKAAGLERKIDIFYEDYRDMVGPFDKFVSIGMFEHVGKNFISVFMDKAQSILKPGGAGLLHTIGKERDTPSDPWTMKYIFPGGYIPILGEVMEAMGEKDLIPLDVENLRLHYALTLDEWARRFEAHVDEIEARYGEKFVRTWRVYLNGCAASFRNGELRLYQILFTNGLNNDWPITRDHLYA